MITKVLRYKEDGWKYSWYGPRASAICKFSDILFDLDIDVARVFQHLLTAPRKWARFILRGGLACGA